MTGASGVAKLPAGLSVAPAWNWASTPAKLGGSHAEVGVARAGKSRCALADSVPAALLEAALPSP